MNTTQSSWNWSALSDFSSITKPVKLHLRNVYASLTIACFVAAIGVYAHIVLDFQHYAFLGAIASIGLLFTLKMIEHKKENIPKRMAVLCAFAFLTGLSLGPLVRLAIAINPQIVMTAFLGSCAIFVCFTLSALWAESRTFLYLAGTLSSMLMALLVMSLANMFIGSRLLFDVQIYLGLAVFCLFIPFDTQLIIQKRNMGDLDFIWHSVDLFLDLVNVFRHLLVILADKEDRKKKK